MILRSVVREWSRLGVRGSSVDDGECPYVELSLYRWRPLFSSPKIGPLETCTRSCLRRKRTSRRQAGVFTARDLLRHSFAASRRGTQTTGQTRARTRSEEALDAFVSLLCQVDARALERVGRRGRGRSRAASNFVWRLFAIQSWCFESGLRQCVGLWTFFEEERALESHRTLARHLLNVKIRHESDT